MTPEELIARMTELESSLRPEGTRPLDCPNTGRDYFPQGTCDFCLWEPAREGETHPHGTGEIKMSDVEKKILEIVNELEEELTQTRAENDRLRLQLRPPDPVRILTRQNPNQVRKHLVSLLSGQSFDERLMVTIRRQNEHAQALEAKIVSQKRELTTKQRDNERLRDQNTRLLTEVSSLKRRHAREDLIGKVLNHINGDPTDNRIENLEVLDRRENR